MLTGYVTTNISSNGASEYRLLKNLKSVDITQFDRVICVHTSPNRIYVDRNLLHQNSKTHKNCDLIYQDVKDKNGIYAENIAWWFENVFDIEHAEFLHGLLIKEIKNRLSVRPTLHMSFFDLPESFGVMSLNPIWKKYPGNANHLSKIGNKKVADIVNKNIGALKQ